MTASFMLKLPRNETWMNAKCFRKTQQIALREEGGFPQDEAVHRLRGNTEFSGGPIGKTLCLRYCRASAGPLAFKFRINNGTDLSVTSDDMFQLVSEIY